jgi:hypothetical protein
MPAGLPLALSTGRRLRLRLPAARAGRASAVRYQQLGIGPAGKPPDKHRLSGIYPEATH